MPKIKNAKIKKTSRPVAIVGTPSRPKFLGKKYLNQSEVSERYGIPESTLENWRCAGKGPHHEKFEDSIVRYRLRALIAWERAAMRKSTSDTGDA